MKRTCCMGAILLCLMGIADAQRLPSTTTPDNYQLTLTPDLAHDTFSGEESISVTVAKPVTEIVLNAVDIEFQDVTIASGGSSQKARVTLDKASEQAKLTVGNAIPAGHATIQVKYTGILDHELRGFYAGKQDDGAKYAATQLEATDARRAFPSFDEPAFKATFDITIIADSGMKVLSNTKALSDTEGPSAGKHTVHFAKTSKMSCYLVAFVIGNFEYIEGSADNIPIRVYTSPGKKQLATFALTVAEESIRYYDQYFGIKYPYGKLDMIGLSDFGPGAMENTGCITYREAFLMLDERRAPVETKKFVASVIAHEIAHQWFGDLVTMQWWDDIWLNEGFASWMSSKPIEAWKPEWHIELNDVRDTTQAMNLDSLENTHPIHQEANTPAEILELADDITYDKTASVLRMLESYLGEEKFRAGVNLYLRQHAYANATAADFWNALAKASNQPVDKIMATFVEQPGLPMVSVSAQCKGTSETVSLEQQRYVYDRAKFEAGNNQIWQIPVCLKTEAGSSAVKCELLAQKKQTFTLPQCSAWIDPNAGAQGFYRSGYDAAAVRALAKNAETALSPADRIMLLADVWASVRVDREKIGDYLLLAEGLRSDRDPQVISLLVNQLQYIGRYLVTDSDQEAYRSWVDDLLSPIAAELGWEPKPGESVELQSVRGDLLRALGEIAHDPASEALARKLAEQELKNPSSVDPELAQSAVVVEATNGDEAFYDQVLKHLKNATTPQQRSLYRQALVSFRDPRLLQRTLDYAVKEARVQDANLIIGRVMQNENGEKLGWDFVRSRWAQNQDTNGAFGGSSSAGLVASTGSFCDSSLRDQVKEFFANHPVPTAERTLKQALERIDYCIDVKNRQMPELASWLQNQAGRAGK